MKFYVTKYALTQGLFEVEGVIDGDHVVTNPSNPAAGLVLRNGVDCHALADDAEYKAKEMAERRVVSLSRELAKIQKLTREPKWRKP